MSDPYRTERRTLGVRADYLGGRAHNEKRPAWTYAESNLQPGQDRKPVRQEKQGHTRRPQSGDRKPRQWSGGFEATALLVVGEQTHPEATLSRRCKHVRADGSTVGDVVARFHYKAPPPTTGTLVQVGALVEASNGAASGAPLFRLTVIRWHEVVGAHVET
ncbi:hypothetical protein [Ralstonia pseudosolanacearum]|uniref:hypothetical protein n=1 Tax=Ralstonia pseudosolanacearum TaxID=1310165 RepID=UPI000AB77276|nr:hypothetical protein [Ralstonia pseudosolanacearum]MDO3558276.1 hypothetical protein [Ralstonia pseudosolanacearum]MDO3575531.1 hypothetical protein [Ralstonia pseudosolanacearum]MDO3586903.1 hypothetical protein [Ralstonia pseudosolanacearum]